MTTYFRWINIHLLIIFFFVFSNVFAQKLILATYQYADNRRLENIEPLAQYLSDSLGLSIEIRSYPTVHAFIEGIQRDEVDIALINTFGYLLLETARTPYRMKPVAVLQVKEGAQDNYKTALLARRDFPADTIADLQAVAARQRLGLVSVGSTSGNLMPRLKLSAVGLADPERQFGAVEYCQNHRRAIEMLLDNKVDVCAVGSTEYFRLLASPQAGQVKLLWLSDEIPLGPVLLHHRLGKATQQRITAHLQRLHRTSPTALEAVKAGWSEALQAERYVPIRPGHYRPFTHQFGDKKAVQAILQQFAN